MRYVADVVLHYSVCVVCLFFFFFKQKTAYEMRISDWSSDVCSSDLVHWATVQRIEAAGHDKPGVQARSIEAVHKALATQGVEFLNSDEIGRASCRERVCQYV